MDKGLPVNGQRLRRLRLERALTAKNLAEKSGLAYDTIGKLELGQRTAHASTIRKLAEALGVEPQALVKQED